MRSATAMECAWQILPWWCLAAAGSEAKAKLGSLQERLLLLAPSLLSQSLVSPSSFSRALVLLRIRIRRLLMRLLE